MPSEGDHRRQQRLQVMLDEQELKVIDAWRFKNMMPSRAATIRELIRRGLTITDNPRVLAESQRDQITGKTTDFGVIDVVDPMETGASRGEDDKSE